MASASISPPAWYAIPSRPEPDPNPPLLEVLAYDPILAHTKLIAEAWDAGGLYQVGSFPAYGRWAEWNGRFRDDVRRFVKGDAGLVGRDGSAYPGLARYLRRPRAARFGKLHHRPRWLHPARSRLLQSRSATWPMAKTTATAWTKTSAGIAAGRAIPDDADVNQLRERQMKNFLSILMVSQGVPMLLMGDETGQSKGGNNNSYCHDSPAELLRLAKRPQTQSGLLRFVRNSHSSFAPPIRCCAGAAYLNHQTNANGNGQLRDSISFHGQQTWAPELVAAKAGNWPRSSAARPRRDQDLPQDIVYVILNAHWETAAFSNCHACPAASPGTSPSIPACRPRTTAIPAGAEVMLEDQAEMIVGARSVAILVGR